MTDANFRAAQRAYDDALPPGTDDEDDKPCGECAACLDDDEDNCENPYTAEDAREDALYDMADRQRDMMEDR